MSSLQRHWKAFFSALLLLHQIEGWPPPNEDQIAIFLEFTYKMLEKLSI